MFEITDIEYDPIFFIVRIVFVEYNNATRRKIINEDDIEEFRILTV